ncbi:MAG: hypothetical protein N2746_10120 [Deltaproteobacteria bacterium]|nr:hypothetical protein [Deltaproteobacteria bacterium]
MKLLDTLTNRPIFSERLENDLEIKSLSFLKEPFEFESFNFTIVTREEGLFFADCLISKRLAIAYAQYILKRHNILLLPEFVEASSVLLLTDLLNRIEVECQIGLEISPSRVINQEPKTDLIAYVRFQRVLAPVVVRINTAMFYKLILMAGLDPHESFELNLIIRGQKSIPLKILGSLKEGDILQIPSRMELIANNSIRIGDIEIFLEEVKMEGEIVTTQFDELLFPVVFTSELGKFSLNEVKEILNQGKVSKILEGKEVRISIGNVVIAKGEIDENHVKISKIFL